MKSLLAVVLAVVGSTPALAEEVPPPQVVIVPEACLQFWSIPHGAPSSVAWDAVLSFAACVQDRSVHRVERAEQLAGFVEQLQASLEPSLRLYISAIDEGPDPVKIRAAYYIGLGQVALMTRARASLATPELRRHLEPLLEPHAEVAYLVFTKILEATAYEPTVASDVVTAYMVRSSRELAASLWRSGWPRADEVRTLLARPR